MKIAHVTATFPPYMGGTGNVCFHNALLMVQRGHPVTVFTVQRGQAPQAEEMSGIKVVRLDPFIKFGNSAVLPQLAWRLRNFDVIHLHYPFFGGEFSALAAWLTKAILVITYQQDVIFQGKARYAEKILRKTVSRWTLRSARYCLYTSDDYAQASFSRQLLQGSRTHVTVLPNGVDASHFSPGEPPAELLKMYKPDPHDRVALLVANLDRAHYFKGVPVFLEAMARLPQNCKAVIVGEGGLRPTYQEIARSLGIESRVFFPGEVSHPYLADYYRLADVSVLPSVTMGEAFGLVLLESLACGTPVIASSLPGVRSVVADGVDGYLASPGSVDELTARLEHVLHMPAAERISMGASGRRKVEAQYAWERIGDQLEEIYRGVLG